MSRNIVLVTYDSLRADHCGFMGYDHNTTQELDTMVDEGIEFKNAAATDRLVTGMGVRVVPDPSTDNETGAMVYLILLKSLAAVIKERVLSLTNNQHKTIRSFIDDRSCGGIADNVAPSNTKNL